MTTRRRRELGPGERAERAKRIRLYWTIGALFLAGGVTGFLIGYLETDGGIMDGSIPAPLAIGLAALFLLMVGVGTPLMLRDMDEVERAGHLQFTAWGGGAFVITYPVWFLLWKGRLLPEPNHLVLFLIFYVGAVLGYVAHRSSLSRSIAKD